jgi:hypothetical protein
MNKEKTQNTIARCPILPFLFFPFFLFFLFPFLFFLAHLFHLHLQFGANESNLAVL